MILPQTRQPFVSIAEAAKDLGCTPAQVVSKGASGYLPIYLAAPGNEFELHLRTYSPSIDPATDSTEFGVWQKQPGIFSSEKPLRVRATTLSAVAASKELIAYDTKFGGEGPDEDEKEYELRLIGSVFDPKGVPVSVHQMIVYVADLKQFKKEESDAIFPEKSESPKELRNLKKLVAVLALLLAEEKKNLKIGDRPNRTAIAEEVRKFLHEKSVPEGLSITSIENHIRTGLIDLDLQK